MGAVSTRPRTPTSPITMCAGERSCNGFLSGSICVTLAPSISLRSIFSAIQRVLTLCQQFLGFGNCTVNAEKREGCRRNRPLSERSF